MGNIGVTPIAMVPYNTAIAASTKWFASNLIINIAERLRVTIVENTGVLINITRDGTNWTSLNSNQPLIASSEYAFDISVRAGDLFNISTPTVGGTTILVCRVDGASII